MHRQVDENVDAVVAYPSRYPGVGLTVDTRGVVGVSEQPPGPFVRLVDVGIAKNFELRVIVLTEKRKHEKGLTMVSKVRRDVSDAKSALGGSVFVV
jgi:hypothetical protein